MIELSVLILAGGPSKRLGVSKQMMDFHGSTLIAQACQKALQLSDNVTVITGAYHHRVEAEISRFKVEAVYNKNWEEGVASSLSLAIKHEFNADRVLLMYCNQPFIPTAHYKKLVELSNQSPKKLIATEAEGRYTIPAVFPHHLFYELTTLKGEETADEIIEQHENEMIAVSSKEAAFSVKTSADMVRLRT